VTARRLRPQSPRRSPALQVALSGAYLDARLRENQINADLVANVDLYFDNLFDEVGVGRVLSSPFGFDLARSSPPRTVGIAAGMKW
jgi:hypothetical protein